MTVVIVIIFRQGERKGWWRKWNQTSQRRKPQVGDHRSFLDKGDKWTKEFESGQQWASKLWGIKTWPYTDQTRSQQGQGGLGR